VPLVRKSDVSFEVNNIRGICMADQQGEQKKQENPARGFYVFMGLVIVTLVIIIGYVVRSYFGI
jgi:hypothetical protein